MIKHWLTISTCRIKKAKTEVTCRVQIYKMLKQKPE